MKLKVHSTPKGGPNVLYELWKYGAILRHGEVIITEELPESEGFGICYGRYHKGCDHKCDVADACKASEEGAIVVVKELS